MLDAVEHRLADRAVEAAKRIGVASSGMPSFVRRELITPTRCNINGVESYWTQSAFR